jgi:beta-lactamase class A
MERVRHEIEALCAPLGGVVGVAARDLTTGAELLLHADEAYPLASVFKVPLMVTVLRQVDEGRIDLRERLRLEEDDKSPGGILAFCHAGLEPTVSDLLYFMITQSDNTATDLLWRRAGLDAVAEEMGRLGLASIDCFMPDREFFLLEVGACPSWRDLASQDLVQTVVDARARDELPALLAAIMEEGRTIDGTAFQRLSDELFGRNGEREYRRGYVIDQGLDNTGSPHDLLELLAMIAEQRCASPPSCRLMAEILTRQEWRDRIPAGLPDDLLVGNKTGSVNGTINDAALVWRPDGCAAVMVVLTRGLSREASARAPGVLADIAAVLWRAFEERR